MNEQDLMMQQILLEQSADEAPSLQLDSNHLPLHWLIVRVGDWLDAGKLYIKNGFAQGMHNQEGQGVPHLRPFNVTNDGLIDLSQVKYIELLPEENSSWVRFGDIVFNNTNSEELVGKTAYFPFDGRFVLSNHMTLIRVLDPNTVDAYWFARKLHYLWQQGLFRALCRRHVNQASVSLERLKDIIIPAPPINEQRTIAQVLQTAQEAIQTRRRELELERERKAALMEYLFSHGTRGEPIKETEIGEMPESWQVVRLGDVCSIRYGLGQPPELDSIGVPMIRATDIKGGRIIPNTVIRVKRKAIPKGKNPFLKKGDIIVVRSGAYTGDIAIYDGRWESAIVGYDLVVTPISNEIEMTFISQYMLGEAVQTYFRSRRDRSAQPHLNAEQLSNTLILCPCFDEQRDIANMLEVCDTKIAALEQEISLLEELFHALLEELMTGRLSTVPLIETENIQ